MSDKVLIIVGDATETLDTMYPYYRLQEAGFTPVVAAPEKRLYQMVMHEIKPGWTITKEWEGYTIQADIAFSQINPEDYAGILFSGGRAPEYIRYDPDLNHLVQQIDAAQKPIASVCHGIEILTSAGIIQGKQVTTVAKCAMDAQQGGGVYIDQETVVSGNLITARTWHDNAPLMRQFLEMLDTSITESNPGQS